MIIKSFIKKWSEGQSKRYYLMVIAAAFILGLLNNVRVDADKRVTWFGGQEVLEKPDGY